MDSDGGSAVLRAISELVREACKVICDARDVSEVTQALHSMASLLYTYDYVVDRSTVTEKLMQLKSVCEETISKNHLDGDGSKLLIRETFYGGPLFQVVAKMLLFDVAPNWLVCFSPWEQENLFDKFFIFASPSEALASLIAAFGHDYTNNDNNLLTERAAIITTAERLLVLCLFENGGIRKLAHDSIMKTNNIGSLPGKSQSTLLQSQLLASIPDKVSPKAAESLRTPYFHITVTITFLDAAKECWKLVSEVGRNIKDRFALIGEVLLRFCRRGHADVVASKMLSKVLEYREEIKMGDVVTAVETNQSDAVLGSSYWGLIIECITDAHAVERLAKALLLEMADRRLQDHEAYCILHMLFGCQQGPVRSIFTERFLLRTIFPVCCLRWILQFAVFSCLPLENRLTKVSLENWQKHIIRRLVDVWAEEKFIQCGEMRQQSYLTAAVGMSLSVLTKEDLESSNMLHLLLKGIGCRLESPLLLVRTMAKKVAYQFSIVVDQSNPLLLDEDDKVEELCNWEDYDSHKPKSDSFEENEVDLKTITGEHRSTHAEVDETVSRRKKKEAHALEPYDPDEVVDLRTYGSDDSEDIESTDSDSDCSLQPYDLSDDESDLHRDKISIQLSDCAANLRKGDQPDLVEKALEVSEKLIRAVPEELENVAPDLARALIHVRCSDVAVEGEEQSAEDKRHSSLVALLACVPLTVEVFTRELYSPHMDVSQRLLVLEVMADAAKEIASSRSMSKVSFIKQGQQDIKEIDKSWYGPGSTYSPIGAGPWMEVQEPVSLIRRYERVIPQRQGRPVTVGKSRRWGARSIELQQTDRTSTNKAKRNNFAPYAASFMLPVMRDYDKKSHGVDFVGKDYIILGELIFMLGVCMECLLLQPEAFALGGTLLSMLRTKEISCHPEPYVRRASLYAASRVIVSLHPLHVLVALKGDNVELESGLEWIRSWALKIAEEDTDTECSSMAMACLHLHSELVLQVSRSIQFQSENEIGFGTASVGEISFKLPGISI